ncbi:uncharacterized protein LOC116174282 [Photinus pyralis]|uniref:uncharacterized protein LOC116174282 n=1 Tax=Photinus pyralis TaxID=7054 RepID=UPI001266F477|nr:uncharacterized protein LOC116174282 [Photinus pyralis]
MSEANAKAEEAESSLCPKKSEDFYKKEFEKFCPWMRNNNAEIVTEKVLLAYFLDQSKNYKSSSLWCMYSKLKCMLRIKNDIDISQFSKLSAFLKKCSVGYSAEKSLVFSKNQLINFLTSACDEQYLLMKVVAIFGLFGACRRIEFYNLCVSDVQEEGAVFVVNLKDTKTHQPRTFTILNDDNMNYTELIKKYINLRPKHVKIEKFFLFYGAGKCTCNPIGINTFGQIPRKIAKYLNLPNADQFTGHSFRRTSATILADSGADIRTLKRHGDWKSDAVAEGCQRIRDLASSSTISVSGITSASSTTNECVLQSSSGISISGNSNCTITININK